jgi:hypothetical protein
MGVDHAPFGSPVLAAAQESDEDGALSSLRYNGAHAESVAFGRWQFLRGRRAPHVGEALFDLSTGIARQADPREAGAEVVEQARKLLVRGDDAPLQTTASR